MAEEAGRCNGSVTEAALRLALLGPAARGQSECRVTSWPASRMEDAVDGEGSTRRPKAGPGSPVRHPSKRGAVVPASGIYTGRRMPLQQRWIMATRAVMEWKP